MSGEDTTAAVRDYLLSTHRDLVESVTAAADAVAAAWDGEWTTDRDAVAGPLERELARRGVLERFPGVIAGAADAAGVALPATPVAAPPYVVVASTGPLLRATLPGGRLVIAIRAFEVERGEPTRYRRRPGGPADAVDIAFHRD